MISHCISWNYRARRRQLFCCCKKCKGWRRCQESSTLDIDHFHSFLRIITTGGFCQAGNLEVEYEECCKDQEKDRPIEYMLIVSQTVFP
jgi:hypothetical protein